eukprot:scaffold356_cov135-Isochrysis_galbana.AAC.4
MDNVSPREAVGPPPIRERGAVSHRVVRGYTAARASSWPMYCLRSRHRAITSGGVASDSTTHRCGSGANGS